MNEVVCVLACLHACVVMFSTKAIQINLTFHGLLQSVRELGRTGKKKKKQVNII